MDDKVRYERWFGGKSILVIEPLRDLDTLREQVSSDEWEDSLKFAKPQRRMEYLTWRAICRELLDSDPKTDNRTIFAYCNSGGPCLLHDNLYLSVSHTREFVAVMLAYKPCAVDIEQHNRKFEQVSSRYIAPCEMKFIDCFDQEQNNSHNEFYGKMWCAKEALYKVAGRRAIDMVRDLRINEYIAERSVFDASIAHYSRSFYVHLDSWNNHYIAYTIEKSL